MVEGEIVVVDEVVVARGSGVVDVVEVVGQSHKQGASVVVDVVDGPNVVLVVVGWQAFSGVVQ